MAVGDDIGFAGEVGPDGDGYTRVLVPTMLPRGNDMAGSGNETAFDIGISANLVEVTNEGASRLTITDGSITRIVPAGWTKACYFPTASQTFDITAPGDWIVTGVR